MPILYYYSYRTRDYLKESNYAQIINTFIMFGDHVLEPTQLCIRMHAIIHRSFGYHLQFHFQHSKSYAILKRIEKSKKQMTELYKLLTLLFPIPLRPFICKMLVLN